MKVEWRLDISGLRLCLILFLMIAAKSGFTQSAARHWNEVMLQAIKADGRGPTIHARNLFHVSAAMYDAWAIYDSKAKPWLLGQTRDGFHCPCEYNFKNEPGNLDSLRSIALSYAAFRILESRMDNFSGKTRTIDTLYQGMEAVGLDRWESKKDIRQGSPTALGNHIADCYLRYGFQDGSLETDDYENQSYEAINPLFKPNHPETFKLPHPNNWQPLAMRDYINQKGGDTTVAYSNLLIAMDNQQFLSAEWGQVKPFAMTGGKLRNARNGEYRVYQDPGPPPLLEANLGMPAPGSYKWGFLLVALWSGMLDPADSVYIDISPNALGGDKVLPKTFTEYGNYYDLKGGVASKYRKSRINPVTGLHYAPNRVLRGDYTRVLAEFWADAINTSTPPGHWFVILNDVGDHPQFQRKWKGKGKELGQLEWDVKSYFLLGGAMHDAAIACWSIKGFYDYVRPISAIRYLASKGQCSDPDLPNFDSLGLPLLPGQIELIKKGDPLAGEQNQNLNKIKIFSWCGPDFVENLETDQAGTGWILGENWWPYQRYSFPTPNFAGYVSGHSTFSTAAAEIMDLITGTPYFPGGLAEYTANKNEFLEFENGPSKSLTLQWATYQDAAEETCLSRIWGGIHPPADDIPGRKVGKMIGKNAFSYGAVFFEN